MPDVAELAGAAAAGDLATVRGILAASPALLNARDHKGATALHYAAEGGRQEVVRWLVARPSRSVRTPTARPSGSMPRSAGTRRFRSGSRT